MSSIHASYIALNANSGNVDNYSLLQIQNDIDFTLFEISALSGDGTMELVQALMTRLEAKTAAINQDIQTQVTSWHPLDAK